MLFVGTLGYSPNIGAAHYFVNAILPRIVAVIPDARFLIVGNHPIASIFKLGEHPNITVTGAVTDVQPYYAQAAVSVVPLRSGGVPNSRFSKPWHSDAPLFPRLGPLD